MILGIEYFLVLADNRGNKGSHMNIELHQVFLLNKKIGDTVYAQDESGQLVAASLPKRYIKEHMLDDMIDSKGNLTDRAIKFASEILQIKAV
jgi:hypothetical protein